MTVAVELVDLGAAAETVGQHGRSGVGPAQAGQQDAFGAGLADRPVAAFEAEVPGQAAAAGLQLFGLDPGPSRRRWSASQPMTACWWQCTWARASPETCGG